MSTFIVENKCSAINFVQSPLHEKICLQSVLHDTRVYPTKYKNFFQPCYTHDGGNSWQAHLLPVEQFVGVPVFINAQNGWISDGKQLFHTQDGGQNWTAVGELPSGTEQVAGLKFINAQQGWFTNGRQVFVTADGGLTWQAIIPVLER